MLYYIGTKELSAKPMTRGEYNAYRGWVLPEDENENDPGYLVVYPEEHQPDNNPYESWSPKETFEASYRMNDKLDFGQAVMMAKKRA